MKRTKFKKCKTIQSIKQTHSKFFENKQSDDKMKRNTISILILLLLLKAVDSHVTSMPEDYSRSEYLFVKSYLTSSPITIESDSDISLYSFPGNGTEDNPYRIENLNITANNETCISISNTTKYFLIQNCYLNGNQYCIYIFRASSSKIVIKNNICTGASYSGLEIRETDSIRIINNTCDLNEFWGLHSTFSHNIEVTNNTLIRNKEGGLFLNFCNSSKIYANRLYSNPKGGILIDDSFNSDIMDNYLINNSFQGGIRLSKSPLSNIKNNTCINNTQFNIVLAYSNNSNVIDNICQGEGSGIDLLYSGVVSVSSNKISTAVYGIYVRDSEYSIFVQNELYECGYFIHEKNPKDYHTYTFTDNLINGKRFGFFTNVQNLHIHMPIYGQILISNCTNLLIENQKIMNTGVAILVKFSRTLTLLSNECSSNKFSGILLIQTNDSVIKNNTLSYNTIGLELEDSNNNLITFNCFASNFRWGAVLSEDSSNNEVYLNSFYSNNINYGTSQAKDDGTSNLWYNEETKEGNYWDVLFGKGNYSIDGGAQSYDLYPLAEPPTYVAPNYYGYFAFLSLVLIIPLMILGYKKFRKRKE